MTRLTSLRFNSTVLNVTAFPAVVVRPELALQLDALLREFPDGDLLLAWSPEQPWVPLENVADFSSFGSAAPVNSDHDPRFKPDLVAPGYTTSARADGVFSGRMDQCSTVRSSTRKRNSAGPCPARSPRDSRHRAACGRA